MYTWFWNLITKEFICNITIFWLFTSLVLGGCASTESPKPKNIETHFILKKAKMKDYPAPLPKYIPIMVDRYQGEASLNKVLRYRGWDFNRDKGFDLLEVLDEKAQVQVRVYDFDFDGKIDYIRRFKRHDDGSVEIKEEFL